MIQFLRYAWHSPAVSNDFAFVHSRRGRSASTSAPPFGAARGNGESRYHPSNETAATCRDLMGENDTTAGRRQELKLGAPGRPVDPRPPAQRVALHAASMKAKRRGPPCCDPRSFAAG